MKQVVYIFNPDIWMKYKSKQFDKIAEILRF
jgi:hypothetical protein